MNSRHVRVVSRDVDDETRFGSDRTTPPPNQRIAVPLQRAIARASESLLRNQQADGSWRGEVAAGPDLTSELLLISACCGALETSLLEQAAHRLSEQQLVEGGWSLYPGGEFDVSTSVKAYYALKLAGHELAGEGMQRARNAILQAGGVEVVDDATKILLAALGQLPNTVLREVSLADAMQADRDFPAKQRSSLSSVVDADRTIALSAALLAACWTTAFNAPACGVRELFLSDPRDWVASKRRLPRLHRVADWFAQTFLAKRQSARHEALLVEATARLGEFVRGDGQREAALRPLLWARLALHRLGHRADDPLTRLCQERVNQRLVARDEMLHPQATSFPVEDTNLALLAITETPSGFEPAVQQTEEWLWEMAETSLHDPRSLAERLLALSQRYPCAAAQDDASLLRLIDEVDDEPSEAPRQDGLWQVLAILDRGAHRLLAMQHSDGGWGNGCSTPGQTGVVLAALIASGHSNPDAARVRAIEYIKRTQHADGSWPGDRGVNCIEGTWLALTGLAAAGLTEDAAVEAGAEWLLACQQACGGWGESPASLDDPRRRGQGAVTASQTAWALLGLIAAGKAEHPAVLRGIRYLISDQLDDGSWHEIEFTARDAESGRIVRRQLWSTAYPLLALATWRGSRGRG